MIATSSSSQLDTLVVDYVCDELPEDARVAFENELMDHPELAAEVHAHQSLRRQWSGVEDDAEVPGPVIARIMEEAELALWTSLAARRESGATSGKPSFLERLTAFLMQPSMAAAMVFVLIGTTGVILSQSDDPPLAPSARAPRAEAPAESKIAHEAVPDRAVGGADEQPAARGVTAPPPAAAKAKPEKARGATKTSAPAPTATPKRAAAVAKAPTLPAKKVRARGARKTKRAAERVARGPAKTKRVGLARADKARAPRAALKTKRTTGGARPAAVAGSGASPKKPAVADATLVKRYRAALSRGRLSQARTILGQLKQRASIKTKLSSLRRELAKAEARAKMAATRAAKKTKAKRATKRTVLKRKNATPAQAPPASKPTVKTK